ncbi:thioesterase family protein [Humibacter sp.]|uniref:thioesterase family protein n=1 Tax=Humibacter sp. TaxID=1940291 RepID=UPI002CF24016|nr:thioesterase family protein [Humibacter sp.]HVX08744.1 thioesterase family protein [Humibacter sp.]
MAAYFERLDDTRFRATAAVGGAWDPDEQHIAPALGLLTHVIERTFAARLADGLQLGRLSFDILGTMPIDVVEVETRMLRPGRTVELVEASMSHGGRAAVTLRAWLMARHDTQALAGDAFEPMAGVDEVEDWSGFDAWPGEFVRTVDVRGRRLGQGRAQVWLRPRVALLETEDVSPTGRLLSILDIANGITPRFAPQAVLFPNIDLTAHLFAQPHGEWLGFDTIVAYGSTGLGATHTVLHDENGVIGTSVQGLTVRERPA